MNPVTSLSLSRRRSLVAAAAVAVVVSLTGRGVGWAAATPSPAAHPATQTAATQTDSAAQGLQYDGLRKTATSESCRGQYALTLTSGAVACTHGPDPAPAGVDVRQAAPVPSVAASQAAVANATLACQGDGVTGPRVQLIYAHAAGVTDRYSSLLSNFQLWAAETDDVFNQSAIETGGTRHIRFVQDASCNPTVLDVTLSATGANNFSNTINELAAQGYNHNDRKYLVWVDANVYCGIAQVYNDDRATQDNPNNGPSGIPGMVARVDNGCWGQANGLVEAHELTHTLGGVQPTAPNATANDHCTDEYDRMCYADAAGVTMRIVCSATTHDNRLDCNHDDYYSTNPPAGSYLATHWNTANSAFLAGTNGTTTTTTVPPTTTTVPPTTTTTKPPTTTTVPPTTTMPPTTTTTKPPTTTTVPPTTTTVPPTTTTTKPPTTTTVPPTTTTTVPVNSGAQNARFVTHAYQDLLNRTPTTAESSYWTNLLGTGFSRDSLAGAITTSVEFRQDMVTSYYQSLLGRAPTAAERDAYVNAIAGGWPIEAVAAVIAGTPEYYALHGSTPLGFIGALYGQLLGITPDAASLTFWVNQLLTVGLSRTTVAIAFVTSGLEHQVLVNFAYQHFLHRAADAGGMAFWAGQLDSGLRSEYMYAYFVGSAEYYANS